MSSKQKRKYTEEFGQVSIASFFKKRAEPDAVRDQADAAKVIVSGEQTIMFLHFELLIYILPSRLLIFKHTVKCQR
jgi:hypothetical protein